MTIEERLRIRLGIEKIRHAYLAKEELLIVYSRGIIGVVVYKTYLNYL